MPAAAPPADRADSAATRPLRMEQPWRAPPLVRVPFDRRHEVRDALAAAGFETWESGTEVAPFLPTPKVTLVFHWEVDQPAVQKVLDGLADD